LTVSHEKQAALVEKKSASLRRQQRLSLGQQLQAIVDPAQLALRVCQADEDPAPKPSSGRGLSGNVLELPQCGLQQSGTHGGMHVAASREALVVECLGALEP
jgi:hypothetical protein